MPKNEKKKKEPEPKKKLEKKRLWKYDSYAKQQPGHKKNDDLN